MKNFAIVSEETLIIVGLTEARAYTLAALVPNTIVLNHPDSNRENRR